MTGESRIEYVEARRVLLDALGALREHLNAVVLVGAQAVYLRTEGRLVGYQAFTTDADVVLDPTRLGEEPALGEAMAGAGFVLTDEPGIWESRFTRPGVSEEIVVPVDLIFPTELAGTAGRRSARLPGQHGKATARKSDGLVGAVVDNSPLLVRSLEAGDDREVVVNVAGFGALFISKAFKLGERLERPDRLLAKDAGDVYRIFDAASSEELAASLSVTAQDDRSSKATEDALRFGGQLFTSASSTGVQLAVEALRGAVPADTVEAVMPVYWSALRQHRR